MLHFRYSSPSLSRLLVSSVVIIHTVHCQKVQYGHQALVAGNGNEDLFHGPQTSGLSSRNKHPPPLQRILCSLAPGWLPAAELLGSPATLVGLAL